MNKGDQLEGSFSQSWLWQGLWHNQMVFDSSYALLDWIWDFFTSIVWILFSNASYGVCVNGQLSKEILIHQSIRQGFPLAPYLYLIATNAPCHLLEVGCVQGQIWGIYLPNDEQLLNAHFFNNATLNLELTHIFVAVVGAIVS